MLDGTAFGNDIVLCLFDLRIGGVGLEGDLCNSRTSVSWLHQN
jgi:hypothetical protein